ncbi:hypothetical protein niasHT_021032 [Heterodera trifolii]|uniref:Effector protein n=1 Tax=Heterodera trifolii TaxID=157864 RepID=A0ABD2KD25_9BILA
MFRFDLRLLPLLLFTLCAFGLNNANSAKKTALNVPPSNIDGNDTDNDEDIANPTITQIEPNQNGEDKVENDEPPPQTEAPDDEKDNDEEDDADSEPKIINQKVLSAQIVPPLDNENPNDEENENANANALAEEPNGDEELTQTIEKPADNDEEEPSDSELGQSKVNGEDGADSAPAAIIQKDDDDGNFGDNDGNGNDGDNINGGAF